MLFISIEMIDVLRTSAKTKISSLERKTRMQITRRKLLFRSIALLWCISVLLCIWDQQVAYKSITKNQEELQLFSLTPARSKELTIEFITKDPLEVQKNFKIKLNGVYKDGLLVCNEYYLSSLQSCNITTHFKLEGLLNKLEVLIPLEKVVGRPLISVSNFNKKYLNSTTTTEKLINLSGSQALTVYGFKQNTNDMYLKIDTKNTSHFNAIEILSEKDRKTNSNCNETTVDCEISLKDTLFIKIKRLINATDLNKTLYLNFRLIEPYFKTSAIEYYYCKFLFLFLKFQLHIWFPILYMVCYSYSTWKKIEKNEIMLCEFKKFRLFLFLFIIATGLLTSYSIKEVKPSIEYLGDKVDLTTHSTTPFSIRISGIYFNNDNKETIDKRIISAASLKEYTESKIHDIIFRCSEQVPSKKCWVMYKVAPEKNVKNYSVHLCDKCSVELLTGLPKSDAGLVSYTGTSLYYRLINTWIYMHWLVHLATVPMVIVGLRKLNKKGEKNDN